MKLDPRHLEILAAIVDHGGLTEGAAVLGKSQPSVSRTVSMLETRVGAPLFEAGRRPLRPTELCLALAAEGRHILAANRAAGEIVSRFREGRAGAVRVAGTPIFMDGVISGMIAGFQTEHPEVRIDQSYGYMPDVMQRLAAGTLDIGIGPMRREDVPQGLSFTAILPGRNVIACRVRHPLVRTQSVRLAAIAAYPWIAPPPDSPLYHDLRNVLEGIGVRDFRISFTGGSLASVTTILSGSDALTVLPYSVVFMLRRQKTLAALPVRIGDPDRHLGILTTDRADPPPALVRFRRFIEAEFTALSGTIQRHEQNALWRR